MLPFLYSIIKNATLHVKFRFVVTISLQVCDQV